MTNYNNIPVVSQPVNLRKKLFLHQLASIYKMENLEQDNTVECGDKIKMTKIGINADHTGYGKTLSMIGLIVRDRMEWDVSIPYVKEVINSESCGLIHNRLISRFDKFNTTLILASSSIISQWKEEFECTNLSVEIITSRKSMDKIDVGHYDVIIVTPNMYNTLIVSHPKKAWKRFIFDEPGHIRVTGMKELCAGFYWFVTATPDEISFYHRNCRGSFMKKILGDTWISVEEQFSGMLLRNDFDFVKSSFHMPETIHIEHKCSHPSLNIVKNMLNSNMRTMLEAGNIEGVVCALGGESRNIIDLVIKEREREITEVDADIKIYKDIRPNDQKLISAQKRKESIVRQLETMKTDYINMLETQVCSICLCVVSEPVLETNCHNFFCGNCLLTWLKNRDSCPLCRKNVKSTDIVYVNTESKNGGNKKIDRELTQLETVIKIITDNPTGKFLVFSAYDQTFETLCRNMDDRNIEYTLIKGNSATRQKKIDNYKNGSTNVIFLNSNSNGSGLNLEETTDIILYHNMSASTREQIIGRANRIGRVKSLNVHHLKVDSG